MMVKSTPGVMAQGITSVWDPGTSKQILGSNSLVCMKAMPARIRSAVVFPKERNKMMVKNHAEEEL